jgi:hypothetical protein
VKITARLVNPYHPNGQTVRGGVVWVRDWQTIDLNDADAALVLADVNIEVQGAHAPKAVQAAASKPSGLSEYDALKAEAKALGIPASGKKAALKKAVEAKKAEIAAAAPPEAPAE